VKKLKAIGLVVVIVALIAFSLDFAIKRSSRALPPNWVSLSRSFVGLYRGDLGLWLTGNRVTTPVTDWSFTDAVTTVRIETRTWYLLPHFVRTDIARNGAQLYLCSEYFAPAPGQPDLRDQFPQARFWNRMVFRDPRIRVKIGEQLFEMRAYPVTDPKEMDVARQAFLNKYADIKKQEGMPESRRPRLHFFRLEPRWNNNS